MKKFVNLIHLEFKTRICMKQLTLRSEIWRCSFSNNKFNNIKAKCLLNRIKLNSI